MKIMRIVLAQVEEDILMVARLMVTGLLKDYYYSHNKFDHKVFNNFGSVSDGKNNICMFRIYTYARKIDTSIVMNSTTTWRLFSRCD